MADREDVKLFFGLACAATLAMASAMLAGCYAPPPPRVVSSTTTTVQTPAVVTVAPPPIREEVVPAAPSDRVVWDPGRWRWNGESYVWAPGHYVERPTAQAVWVPGHWVDHGNGWVWDEGHWQG